MLNNTYKVKRGLCFVAFKLFVSYFSNKKYISLPIRIYSLSQSFFLQKKIKAIYNMI